MGKASLDKGKRAERDVARFLEPWWPQSARMVTTGYRTSRTAVADQGDLRGLPFTVQVKDHTGTPDKPALPFSDGEIRRLLFETRVQADAAGHVVGVLIEKRRLKASPREWWAHVDGLTLAWLVLGPLFGEVDTPVVVATRSANLRLRFGELVPMLLARFDHEIPYDPLADRE